MSGAGRFGEQEVLLGPASLTGRFVAAIALIVLVVACNKSPTSPTVPITPTPTPTGLNPSISVELVGPDRVAPGQSAQYSIVVHSSDGIVRVPSGIQWIASPPSFLQIDASGLATGTSFTGGAAVTADVTIDGPGGGARRVSKSVIVLPEGTYRMFGTVADEEFQVLVPNAVVEVTPGSLTTTTDSNGAYSFYGVPADADIKITAYGYAPYTQHLSLSGTGIHLRRDFRLSQSGPYLALAGNYTLDLDVLDGCASDLNLPLPANLQHRTYDAVITQGGLALQVVLTEPRFSIVAGRGNGFGGRVTDSGANFTLDDNGPTVSVAEHLPNGTYLFVSGLAITSGSAAGLSGIMNGSLWNSDTRFWDEDTQYLGSCSGRLGFTLRPR